jgi:hypothetical protein
MLYGMHILIATAVPRNKTTIYAEISDTLATITSTASFKVWRNWTSSVLSIKRGNRLIVANSDSEYIVHNFSNHRYVTVSQQLHTEAGFVLISRETA